MLHLFAGLDIHTGLILVIALIFVFIYEIINGFHDTANAIAIVIYAHALRSQLAVIMSGIFNFLGVIMGGLSIAYAIVHLLPTDLLLNVNSTYGLAMMFSMLLAAILWNLGTWYVGLPASSSHTIIGAVIGIGLTHALINDSSVISALNIPKLIEIILSLVLSPLIGLVISSLIAFILRYYLGNSKRCCIHLTPAEREKKDGKRKPQFWTHIALILSAAGVSFSHGANDGQKGIGLIMLVLISAAPANFVINMNASSDDISRTRDAVNYLQQYYTQHQGAFNNITISPDKQQLLSLIIDNDNNILNRPVTPLSINNPIVSQLANNQILGQEQNIPSQTFYYELSWALINQTSLLLSNLNNYGQLNPNQRSYIRCLLMYIADITDKIAKLPETSITDKRLLSNLRQDLLNTVEYAPLWIIVSVALALALGTMVGWRRVVTTINERIGKTDMTYAQGLSVQMTAAISIGIASYTGMPVSTTHVISSAMTGTMLVDGGGIQSKTVQNILIAWILTLPITIILASGIYWLTMKFI